MTTRRRARAFLDSLDEAARDAVFAASSRRQWAPSDVLFRAGEEGDSMQIVLSGRLAATVGTASGNNVTLWVGGPGQVVGELALVRRDHRRTSTVHALEDTETLVLDRSDFERLRMDHESLVAAMLELLAVRVDRLSRRVAEAHHDSVETRVARRLVELHRVYDDGTGRTLLPFTQDDLAGMAGATRPTVNQALRAMEDNAILRLGRGRVEILDIDGLLERAQ